MNTDRARDLLENLLERAKATSEKTFLTTKEVEALAVLLIWPSSGTDAGPSPAGPAKPRLVLPILTAEEVDEDAMLCVDFGTSFSKAFISLGAEESDLVLMDLAVGSPESRLISPSELFIDGGRLYFGSAARNRWNQTEAPAERLIDSIKQFITLNKDVSMLGERPMLPVQDPTQQFTQRDILVLYLAHLMALTERALAEKGRSANIKRRFTHPAWKDEVREQNEREMRRLMAQAIVLARSAPDEFVASMPLDAARGFLDQLTLIPAGDLPAVLIGDPVREATAAGAGALLATRDGKREAYLVLDIGAGTTDVAGFYCANNPHNDRMRVFEVASAADAKNMAGNTLDNALQRFVLDRSSLSLDSAEARIAGHALRRQLRQYKEQLFANGNVLVELSTDELVQVELIDFLKYSPVAQFTQQITEMVARSAVALAGDLDRIKLVATGGGAGLPIVKLLSENGARYEGKYVTLDLVSAIPDEVRRNNPDLIDPYPQIAVALGGSLPNLPEQRTGVQAGLTRAQKTTLTPVYKS